MLIRENISFIDELKDESEIQQVLKDYSDYFDLEHKKFGFQIFNKNFFFDINKTEENNKINRISRVKCYQLYQETQEVLKIVHKISESQNITAHYQEVIIPLLTIGLSIPLSTYKKIVDNFDSITQNNSDLEKQFLKEAIIDKKSKLSSVAEFEDYPLIPIKSFFINFFQIVGINELIYILNFQLQHLEEHFNKNTAFTSKLSYLPKISELSKFKTIDRIADLGAFTSDERKMIQFLAWGIKFKIIRRLSNLSYSISGPFDNNTFIYNLLGFSEEQFNRINSSKKFKSLSITRPDADINKLFNFESIVSYSFRINCKEIFSFEDEKSCSMEDNQILSLLFDKHHQYIAQPSKTLPESAFSYISQHVDEIKKAITSDKKCDILIWGEPGYGKTELVKTIIKSIGMNMLDINDTIENYDIGELNIRVKKFIELKEMTKGLSGTCILVDEAEDILLEKQSKNWINSNIGMNDITTFWLLNNTSNIHPSSLRRFDYIFEMNKMPFDNRVALANKILGEHDTDSLSHKIAQAIHTPAEIISALEWAKITNNFSWKAISQKVTSYQELISKSDQDKTNVEIKVIPPSNELSIEFFSGYDYVKEEAQEFIELFTKAEKFKKMNAKIPKGLLLAGEPGVGKTLFAKCFSSSVGTNLITASSSDLAANPHCIKSIFDKAKSLAPCILFLDEIDVLGSNVVSPLGDVDTQKQEILNQLLAEMDGFEKYSGVLVIGATHRSELLDPSLRRSGRFGKTIYFREPSKTDREAIYKHYTKDIPCGDDIDYNHLAKLSSTFTSADIAQAVNEAALIATMKDENIVSNQHLIEATDKVFFGTTMNGFPLSEAEKIRTAIHEAGHALISVKNGVAVKRATIKPHLNFLGMVENEDKEGDYGFNLEEVKIRLQVLFAGMLAEKVILGNFKSGNSSDLRAANNLVFRAFEAWGMSNTLNGLSSAMNQSEKQLIQLETEKQKIFMEEQENTEKWLKDNKKHLFAFTKLLLEYRSLDYTEMNQWFEENINIQKDKTSIIIKMDLSAEEILQKLEAENDKLEKLTD